MLKRFVLGRLRKLGVDVRRVPSSEFSPIGIQDNMTQRPNAVIFDVGAHEGETARAYRQVLPQSTIHSFEPFPPSFAALTSQGPSDPFFAHQVALSDGRGRAMLRSNVCKATNSLLSTSDRVSSYWGSVIHTLHSLEVPITTLDAFCEEHAIARIDILKLDVQGAEARVLRGSDAMLDKIQMEILVAPTYDGQTQFDEVCSIVMQRGFRLFGLYELVQHRNGELKQLEALFIRG